MHFKKIIIKKAFLVVVLRLCEHGKDWQNGCGCTPSAGAVPMPCYSKDADAVHYSYSKEICSATVGTVLPTLAMFAQS